MHRPALALSFVLSLAAGALQAQTTVTIDFAEYASPVSREYPAAIGDPLRSNGFDFFSTELFIPGARNALATWGTNPSDAGSVNRPSNAGGSTALAATQPGDPIDMVVAGDDVIFPSTAFTIHSIDIAHLYSTPYVPGLAPFNLNFFGILDTGEDLVQTFTVAVPPLVGGARTPVLQTFLFDDRWRNVVNVYWYQTVTSTGAAHQFTNIRAAIAPEPSTYVLMATGLGALLVVARRRRPTS